MTGKHSLSYAPMTPTTIPGSDSRERILEAAARVYAQYGFRGATTRLIAQEAGVNEVTLFRLFGSKAQLFDELLQKQDRKSTCLNSSHANLSYAVFCLKKKE